MEPYQARLTFFVFMLLSFGIVFNALYLQQDAGLTGGQGASLQFGAVDGTEPPISDKRRAQLTLITAITRELSRKNYFPGGLKAHNRARMSPFSLAPATLGAIMAWQHDQGLAVTGRASDALLKTFLFGVDGAVSGEAQKAEDQGGEAASPAARRLVAEIQGVLAARGHYKGQIDGATGALTAQAVRSYERDRSLPVTGRVSGLLVQELARHTGVSFTAPLL